MTAERITVVVATKNQHKVRELAALFAGLPVELVPMTEVVRSSFNVIEDGATFEENARKKARLVCEESMMVTLADDSGLEVDALGGRPGVRSARFAHEKATDAENNAALLSALEEFQDPQRTARFRCVLCLYDPWQRRGADPIVAEGACEGRIAAGPRGSGGFGYDPLFLVTDQGGRAMAELSDAEKNAVSHRGRAAARIAPHLDELVRAHLGDVERISGRRPSIARPR